MTDSRLGAAVAQVLAQITGVAARLGASNTQVAMQLDPTTVQARESAAVAQVAMVLDPTTVRAQLGGSVVQVLVQVKRGYVTDFYGRPIKVWDGGQLVHVRTLN